MIQKKLIGITFSFLLILLTFMQGCTNKNEKNKEEWVPLFNGKNPDGWDIKITGHQLNDNYKNTFRVEDSMLRIAYDQYTSFDDKFGHLYYQTPFSYYRLRFQYRFTGNQPPGGADWNVKQRSNDSFPISKKCRDQPGFSCFS